MVLYPLDDEPLLRRRKITLGHLHRIDSDDATSAGMNRVDVGWRVVLDIDSDPYPRENADSRQG